MLGVVERQADRLNYLTRKIPSAFCHSSTPSKQNSTPSPCQPGTDWHLYLIQVLE